VTDIHTHTHTHTHTHRQKTHDDSIYHTSIASCGKKSHITSPCPFQEQFVIHRLGLGMINLCTKFKVSTFNHYKDIKGDEKWEKLGWSGVPLGHRI